jgi:uncharacterized protein YktA (UPF0223 family)
MKEIEYDIDYSMFSVPETIMIVSFFNLVVSSKQKRTSKELMISKYQEYRKVVNSIQLEKQFDKMLHQKTGVSIYQTMKKLLK